MDISDIEWEKRTILFVSYFERVLHRPYLVRELLALHNKNSICVVVPNWRTRLQT